MIYDIYMEVKKIGSDKDKKLGSFLEKLCQFSLEKGATAVGIISVNEIEFNEENTEHDIQNESLYWPYVTFNKDPISKILKAFKKALVFKICYLNSSSVNRLDTIKKVYEIAGKGEAYCFYNGYHLAVSLAAENCRTIYCQKENDCQSLTRGCGCRYPLIARPSIEACRLDRSKIIEILKWETDESKQNFMGMVFVD